MVERLSIFQGMGSRMRPGAEPRKRGWSRELEVDEGHVIYDL